MNWGQLTMAFSSGLTAFREAMLSSDAAHVGDWIDSESRKLRYAMNWASYENTIYRNVNSWAVAYRHQCGLYKYIRSIHGPAYRLGEFYKAHLFGGILDSAAEERGAIPIATENEALRPAIADLWKRSRWSVNKDVLTLRGAVLGDIMIQVVDDAFHEHIYLEILYPGLFKSIEKDSYGNIRAYEIEESRQDPRINTSRAVKYNEVVSRDGEMVVYETFLDDAPYAWPDNMNKAGEARSVWREPYGFVPTVHILHNDIGLSWGYSEAHAMRSKIQEVDDLASQISDQIRKTVDPIWLMKGIKDTPVALSGADATTDRPEPGREELNAIWGIPVDGDATAMVAELDYENALRHIDTILTRLEQDYPELATDVENSAGDASGRALRVARQKVVAKVIQRRTNYDSGLVAAQQMAIAIGGFRNYDGYEGFNLDSYAKGDLDHSIANRSVFDEDPLDATEISAAFWDSAGKAAVAKVPLRGFLVEAGWSKERIEKLLGAENAEIDRSNS